MTTHTKRGPILAATIVTGALVLGAAGAVNAHGGTSDSSLSNRMMVSGHLGSGHLGSSHMGQDMMGSHTVDEEAMAEIQALMTQLHARMPDSHTQAAEIQAPPETDDTAPVDDTQSPSPEEG